MSDCNHLDCCGECHATVAKLQAEVKLQSDSADYWEDEAMNHVRSNAKLQALVESFAAVDNARQAENAKLQAERDSLMNDMQRIYDNCSDVDLIIDIAGAAVEEK